jgi:hypothetical protein
MIGEINLAKLELPVQKVREDLDLRLSLTECISAKGS